VTASTQLIMAWADTREGVSRIYYRVRDVAGQTWLGPASGQPLLSDYHGLGMQHFHPQLAVSPKGGVGCTFYGFGPKGGFFPMDVWFLIDVLLTFSCDAGASFGAPVVITEQPWDPEVDAPLAHGLSDVTFIGEYFGVDAFKDAFAVVWTDTRTGVQE